MAFGEADFAGEAFRLLDGIEGTGVSRSSDAKVSQFVKRIRTFMTETLTGPLLQTCVQKADSLTDCRTLSTAGFQGRANTDTRGAHLFETTLKLRSDMRPDTHIGYGPRTHEHSFKCACDALQLRSRLSHRLALALKPWGVSPSLR